MVAVIQKGNLLKGIIAGMILIVLLGAFAGGFYTFPKFRPCPGATSDTIVIQDTNWYHIVDSLNHIVDSLKNIPEKRDTIFFPDSVFIPPDVDVDSILWDYYAAYRYEWEKQDTNIQFRLNTTISHNKPLVYDFSYKILKPSTTVINSVDQSVHYTKYVTLGVDFFIKDIKYSEIEALYVAPKFYVGAGYAPGIGVVGLKAGITLFKLK
jgi:hypothetical protein